MAINYSKVNWATGTALGPTNFNHMDEGIKAACDQADTNAAGISDIQSDLSDLTAAVPEFDCGSKTSGTIAGYGSATTLSVTFSKTFTNIPTVVVTPISYSAYNTRAIIVTNISVTTTGFDVTVIQNGATSSVGLSSNRRLDWIAIGNP